MSAQQQGECPACGEPFTGRKGQLSCGSDRCRKALSRRKRRADAGQFQLNPVASKPGHCRNCGWKSLPSLPKGDLDSDGLCNACREFHGVLIMVATTGRDPFTGSDEYGLVAA